MSTSSTADTIAHIESLDNQRTQAILTRNFQALEALMGDDAYGINRATIERMVADVSDVAKLGVEVAIVIGGGNIYKQMLPYCENLYLTKFKNSYGCDTFLDPEQLKPFIRLVDSKNTDLCSFTVWSRK